MKAVRLLEYGGQLAFDDVHRRGCSGSRRARASDPASGPTADIVRACLLFISG